METVTLDGYDDVTPIAKGGGSVVFRARHRGLDRVVAVKVIDIHDAAAARRFQRELDITLTLGREHPNIVTVLDTATLPSGQPCLVMEYHEAGSLHDRLVESGPLPPADVAEIGAAVADALAFAHQQGVVHRDVKPQNILRSATSYVLSDFGISRRMDAGYSTSMELFSYRHASPQVLDGELPAAADDVYSLGSTLYTLLEGNPPFSADDPDDDTPLAYLRRVRTGRPRPMTRADVPADLADAITRCLARRREDRFAAAADLAHALAGGPLARPRVVWRPVVAAAAVALVLGGAAGFGWTWWQAKPSGSTAASPTPPLRDDPAIAPVITGVDDQRSGVVIHWRDTSGGTAVFAVTRRAGDVVTLAARAPAGTSKVTIAGLDPAVTRYCFQVSAVVTDRRGQSAEHCVRS
ncbi:Probable serine/threonine-protein kinase pknK [Alloactinosynnema sp. L-07]|uniref:serine/threonine-protein kinase n=1 Tax=Alloactinosynnema sp. L-07 TaxID=1653480 RepID=UPI00065EF59B|nr:serine/threonine-protein kinase [Alloactinosynnema sp. L-07]CRK60536.1 Probable serine/threonine-protein kinase pknK [Alloactinosynnema sp. L-07]